MRTEIAGMIGGTTDMTNFNVELAECGEEGRNSTQGGEFSLPQSSIGVDTRFVVG